MDFLQKLKELQESIQQFMEIHNNPHDTSKHNETATKLAAIEELIKKATTTAVAATKKLNGSVGQSGKNEKSDVLLVQSLLNKNGASLTEDGACGPKTIAAINKFQLSKLGKQSGLVEPDSATFKALNGQTIDPVPETTPIKPTEKPTEQATEQPIEKPADNTPTSNVSIKKSVGKGGANEKSDVLLVQSLLNRHGAKLGVDGDCGAKSITAIEKFQQEKLGTSTGLIEPDSPTMKALLEKPDKVVEGEEEIVTKLGATGKLGNTITNKGAYIISTPPNANGSYPLVLLFSGKGQNASTLLGQVPDVYYTSAIMVFSGPSGSFAAAQPIFQAVLKEKNISATTISICGYSLGGQAAYKSYGSATKAVGLIDPTTYYKNLAQIDSKAVLSCNPPIWGFSANKPKEPNYKVKHCLEDAVKIANQNGGYGETRPVAHGKYPQYFLSKFKSKLI